VPKLADGSDDWRTWSIELLTMIRANGERGPWLQANRATLEAMRKAEPKEHAKLLDAIHQSDEVQD
jgi:hypothetical protein